MHITEFSPPSRDNKRTGPQPSLTDDEVAAWQVNYYTLAFSKPYVHEVTRWFLVDELGGRGIDAGVIARDGKLKPAYFALRRLLKETWSSSWAGTARRGEVSFRGFYGDYEVSVPGIPQCGLHGTAGRGGSRESDPHGVRCMRTPSTCGKNCAPRRGSTMAQGASKSHDCRLAAPSARNSNSGDRMRA